MEISTRRQDQAYAIITGGHIQKGWIDYKYGKPYCGSPIYAVSRYGCKAHRRYAGGPGREELRAVPSSRRWSRAIDESACAATAGEWCVAVSAGR